MRPTATRFTARATAMATRQELFLSAAQTCCRRISLPTLALSHLQCCTCQAARARVVPLIVAAPLFASCLYARYTHPISPQRRISRLCTYCRGCLNLMAAPASHRGCLWQRLNPASSVTPRSMSSTRPHGAFSPLLPLRRLSHEPEGVASARHDLERLEVIGTARLLPQVE